MREEALRKSDGQSHRKSLLHLIKRLDAKKVAEIGVYRCVTAELVLREFGEILDLYAMVDQWKPFGERGKTGEDDAGCPLGEMWDQDFKKAQWLEDQYDCARVVRGDSAASAELFPDKYFDIVYIDADHSYAGIKRDIQAWLPKVRTGGILCGHDYYTRWPGVVKAVDELLPAKRLKFLKDTVWYVVVEG